MANSYMTVETTNLIGCVCYSLQADKDIPNGAIVGKGDLVDKEQSVYKAEDTYGVDNMYLVANPAWSYDGAKATDQNEENYTNVKKVPFRVYKLEKDKKFKVANITLEATKGDHLKYESGAWAKDETNKSAFKLIDIEEFGFPYCVGSYGVKVTGDSSNDYGYAADAQGKTKKYVIEVVTPEAGE